MLLFTDGLVRRRSMSRAAGLATASPGRRGVVPLDDLREYLLAARTGGLRRDDDICLLGCVCWSTPSPLRQKPRSTVAAEHAQRPTPFTTEARAHP